MGDDVDRQGSSDGGSPSDAMTEPSGEGSPQAAGKGPGPAEGSDKTQGIPLGDGSVVTVDDHGRLVLAGPGRNTRVLDESHAYTIEHRADESVSILDDSGNEVVVEDTAINFTDSEGKQVVVDVSDDSKKASDESAANDGDETELSDETGRSGAVGQPSESERTAPIAAVIAAVIVAAAAAGIVLWRRRKR